MLLTEYVEKALLVFEVEVVLEEVLVEVIVEFVAIVTLAVFVLWFIAVDGFCELQLLVSHKATIEAIH